MRPLASKWAVGVESEAAPRSGARGGGVRNPPRLLRRSQSVVTTGSEKWRTKSDCAVTVEQMKQARAAKKERRAQEAREERAKRKALGRYGEFVHAIANYRDAHPDKTPAMDAAAAACGAPIGQAPGMSAKISVFVRARPPLAEEEGLPDMVDVVTRLGPQKLVVHDWAKKYDGTCSLHNNKFQFERVFDGTCGNEDVYAHTLRPAVADVLEGGTVTCFAYGQTGSGKTYTMVALTTLAMRDLYRTIDARNAALGSRGEELHVQISYFEMYMGKIYDLLAPGEARRKALMVLEDGQMGVHIKDLRKLDIHSMEDFSDVVATGGNARSTRSTVSNDVSSRSHAVIRVTLVKKTTTTVKQRGRTQQRVEECALGELVITDLAGSERASNTMQDNARRRAEGAEINKSLLALKECIRALDTSSNSASNFTPFRGSKLTLLLRDSLLADSSRTIMIATVSPGMHSCDHTLNTLRYACRVKRIGGSTTVAAGGAAEKPLDAAARRRKVEKRRRSAAAKQRKQRSMSAGPWISTASASPVNVVAAKPAWVNVVDEAEAHDVEVAAVAAVAAATVVPIVAPAVAAVAAPVVPRAVAPVVAARRAASPAPAPRVAAAAVNPTATAVTASVAAPVLAAALAAAPLPPASPTTEASSSLATQASTSPATTATASENTGAGRKWGGRRLQRRVTWGAPKLHQTDDGELDSSVSPSSIASSASPARARMSTIPASPSAAPAPSSPLSERRLTIIAALTKDEQRADAKAAAASAQVAADAAAAQALIAAVAVPHVVAELELKNAQTNASSRTFHEQTAVTLGALCNTRTGNAAEDEHVVAECFRNVCVTNGLLCPQLPTEERTGRRVVCRAYSLNDSLTRSSPRFDLRLAQLRRLPGSD